MNQNSADAEFVRLLRRIMFIATILKKSIDEGKTQTAYKAKLKSSLDEMYQKFHLNQSDLRLIINYIHLDYDGEKIPEWII
jgi:hypothetical protein